MGTIVIYHTPYYSERRLYKALKDISNELGNETHNVRGFFAKLKVQEDLTNLISRNYPKKFKNATFEGSISGVYGYNILNLYKDFVGWRNRTDVKKAFAVINRQFSKEYDAMDVEHSKY
jgi:hypothetical protein